MVPGKYHRKGMTIVELMDMFPTESAATAWFESVIWPNGRYCPKCGSLHTREVPNAKPMPYWCKDCRSYFSVKTGTAMQSSKIPLRKWAIAIYLCLTSLKSVSSMKLQRDLGVSQPTAWFMMHRIRKAWGYDDSQPFDGPAEVDETYFGGKRKNMSNAKRKELTSRGAVGKTAVVGIKDRETNQVRAEVIVETDAETLQNFVEENTAEDATVCTDDAAAYKGMDRLHESVRHSVGEYVWEMAHANGIESFRAMLKRAHGGTFHKISLKHLQRYVSEFAGKHNIRNSGTLAQMRDTVARLVGERLLWRDLVADNGLPNLSQKRCRQLLRRCTLQVNVRINTHPRSFAHLNISSS
ncbi:MAG: IS1595 family transposase [Rhodobacteraceae bacterium]|nr:IS1595 family transposase [Paracoccaceae bacterium]